jgi:hypothetical protein
MKSKLYLLLILLTVILSSSCKKWLPENRIVGSWKLVDAEKKRFLDSDDFTTGYEPGTFVFNDNGTATYVDPNVQLNGSWSMHRRGGGYYDENGTWQDQSRTEFDVDMYNFPMNRALNWEFDDIDFRNSGDKLFGYMYGAGYRYRYDFRKQ